MDGKNLYYQQTPFADYSSKPVMTAGTDEVYIFDVKKFNFGFPFIIVFQSRLPSFRKVQSIHEQDDRHIVYSGVDEGMKTVFNVISSGYPHEDSGYSCITQNYIY